MLLDTHIALWLATDVSRLSPGERDLIDDPDRDVLFSPVSIWELRLKWNSAYRSGQRKGPADPNTVLRFFEQGGFEQLPLTARVAAAELAQPLSHRDPFDELLLVQAQEEGLELLTRDAVLLEHPLAISG